MSEAKNWVGQPFDFVFVGSCYVGLAVLTSMSFSSEEHAYLSFAALSAVLMLRRRHATRIICLLVFILTSAALALHRLQSA